MSITLSKLKERVEAKMNSLNNSKTIDGRTYNAEMSKYYGILAKFLKPKNKLLKFEEDLGIYSKEVNTKKKAVVEKQQQKIIVINKEKFKPILTSIKYIDRIDGLKKLDY